MKNLIQKIKNKINDRMDRAYGYDEFVIELIVAGLFFVMIDLIPGIDYISGIGLSLLGVGCFRCLSTNIEKREKELQAFINLKAAFHEWISELIEKYEIFAHINISNVLVAVQLLKYLAALEGSQLDAQNATKSLLDAFK